MQNKKILAVVAALSIAAGCSAQFDAANKIGNLPETVVALAAPGQDLTTARLVPQDNCYWYDYSGPVETTLVPLRATSGGQICAAREA
ncbi:hypothetical protein [uncultured Ruegeria sp.]|uniref:hypothetical protein n=1 Tax=uncultured Ruegeria sp. TaxID=259304 RepID=UPI002619C199|nr:hypothetical protein [uncultured Ruegeria sp.]